MNSSEEVELLELCETEMDDLKPTEELKVSDCHKLDLNSKPQTTAVQDTAKDEEIQLLYSSMALNLKDPNIVTHVRLDTLHIHGVNEMSTKDVYEFFEPMKPLALEWINDSSCNVVWPDEPTAAQALLKVSQPEDVPMTECSETQEPFEEKVNEKDSNKIVELEEDDEDEGSEDGEISESKINDKVIWRTTIRENQTTLKFRFATLDDKKVRGAEKYSEYYKKYGNPNFGGMKGLISNSRKRRFREKAPDNDFPASPSNENEDANHDQFVNQDEDHLEDARLRISHTASEKSEKREAVSKRPKMKMYADEEERKSQSLKKSSQVLSRLGSITVNLSRNKSDEEDEDERTYDDLEVSSPQEFGSKSVWDRLQVEVPNTRYSSGKERKRMRDQKSSSDHASQRDLRKKLQRIRDNKKEHRSPLLVATSTK